MSGMSKLEKEFYPEEYKKLHAAQMQQQHHRARAAHHHRMRKDKAHHRVRSFYDDDQSEIERAKEIKLRKLEHSQKYKEQSEDFKNKYMATLHNGQNSFKSHSSHH